MTVAPASTPMAVDSPDTRTRILWAALEMFAERGFDGASTRDIAARAGVQQRLLSYYFESKDLLWRAAFANVMQHFQDHLAKRLEGLRGVDGITITRLMVREFVVLSARYPQVHSIILREGSHPSPRFDWIISNYIKPSFEVETANWLRLAPTATTAIGPVSLFFGFMGASAMVFSIAKGVHAVTGVDPMDASFIERHADAIVALFCGSER